MAGRPSAYDAVYCEQVIEWLAGGYSFSGVAGKLRVSRQTLYNWSESHPEFAEALDIGRAASAAWWEEQAIKMATGESDGHGSTVIFALKNRVHQDWKDRQEVTGADGSPLTSPVIMISSPDEAE